MNTYIALLRGINLGKHKRMLMKDLCEAITACGMRDVRSYIQSGNVVFSSRAAAEVTLRAKLESAIVQRFGFVSEVFIRTPQELHRLIQSVPFAETPGRTIHVTFLHQVPAPDTSAGVIARSDDITRFHVDGRHVITSVPKPTPADSPFTRPGLDRLLGVTGTTRNLATVTSIARLCAE